MPLPFRMQSRMLSPFSCVFKISWRAGYWFREGGNYTDSGVARKECMMTVKTIGGTDHASWYDIFRAVIAVDMICTRNSPAMNGIITGVGKFCFSVPIVFAISAD